MVVSHETGMLRDLCNRAILLEDGRIAAEGDISSMLDRYAGSLMPAKATP